MGRNKDRDRSQPDKSSSDKPVTGKTGGVEAQPADDRLALSEWSERKRPAWRSFPGPRMLDVPLRVTIDRTAYAELIAHAKETLDQEVCGVLVGDACEDDEGPFIHIKDIIRGLAADQSGTHVTYTQETWNLIHKTMEERFPKSLIVGWYHSHPGYGVEFSEMDRFIQQNFFSGATQVGLVIDPLSGDVGLCVNAGDEIKYINRFWVEGREQRAWVPASRAHAATPASGQESAIQDRLEAVEIRLEQTIRAFDEMRNTIYRFVLSVGMVIGVGIVAIIGYTIYSNFTRTEAPPLLRSYARIPIKIGDKVVLLGVEVIGWQIPVQSAPQEPEKKESDEQQGNANSSASGSPSEQGSGGPPSQPAANSNASSNDQGRQ
jgi:proteasome lid subunit RPN8/RPN11